MFYRIFALVTFSVFSSASASDSYDSLISNFCENYSKKQSSIACQSYVDSMTPHVQALCEAKRSENDCDRFNEEFAKENLGKISCSAGTLCNGQKILTGSTVSCPGSIVGKTFDAFVDLAKLPLSIANLIQAGFAEDRNCFYDHQRKIAPALLFNLFAPNELKIADNYIQLDEKQQLVSAMKEWSCTEINRFVYAKSKKLQEFLADPKNRDRQQGLEYFSFQSSGLLHRIKQKMACLNPESRAKYICYSLTSLVADIAVGATITKFAKAGKAEPLLKSSPNKFQIVRSEKEIYYFEQAAHENRLRVVQPAHVHTVRFEDGKTMRIVIPESGVGLQTPAILRFRAERLIAEMPDDLIKGVDEFVFSPKANKDDAYWKNEFKNNSHVSGATAGPGRRGLEVTMYPAGIKHPMTSILRHELGHILAAKKYGSTQPPARYSAAVKKDGTSVSTYGDNNHAEDFAEAVRVYVETDGGTKNPAKLEKFRNRFQEIDQVLNTPIERRAEVMRAWKEHELKRLILLPG